MKIRNDFVSNSSSSSYIIAVGHERMQSIARDIAVACINKDEEFHDPFLQKRNERILDFCMNTYRLAFLGNIVLEDKVEEFGIEKFVEMFGKDNAEEEFNRWVSSIKASKKRNVSSYLREYYRKDSYDLNAKIIYHHVHTTASGPVVCNDDMTYEFNRYHFKSKRKSAIKKLEVIKERAQKLFDYAKFVNDNSSMVRMSDIYEITQDTIDNTKDLLRCGYKFDVTKTEMKALIKKYEGHLKDGERIFSIREAYQGDGYGDFYIYCEDGANGFDAVTGIKMIGSGD